MKIFQNKETAIKFKDERNSFYSDFIRIGVNQVPQGGFTPSEMKQRLKVLEVLDRSTDTLEFEDADAQVVLTCVNNIKWVILHKDIVDFLDYVKEIIKPNKD